MKTNSTPKSPQSKAAIQGGANATVNKRPVRPRAKSSGQALVFIALALLVLIAMAGLAIDGGAIYNERRASQNGTDAAALAGTRLMLTYYEWMVGSTSSDQDDWPDPTTAAIREGNVRQAINTYAARNGIDPSTVEAYFVDDNKHVVSVNNGPAHDCGFGIGRGPCQVGHNGVMPWTMGAKGIEVKGSGSTNTFFLGALGWNVVSAAASTTAFMGVATTSGYDTKFLPVGFFTYTQNADALQPEHNYTLIAAANGLTSGQWGWLDYNNQGGNANVLRAWEDCGFNASVTVATWPTWCPADASTQNTAGPLIYWTGWPAPDTNNPYPGLTVRFGAGLNGWWLNGNSGDINSGCQHLQAADAQEWIVPMFDSWTGTGQNTFFHLYRMGKFLLHTGIIQCGGNASFDIQGIFEQEYMPGSSGWHGDLRHNSLHLIFIDP
jgi:hypothetical protein